MAATPWLSASIADGERAATKSPRGFEPGGGVKSVTGFSSVAEQAHRTNGKTSKKY
jgi:hypothetical protein